MNIIDKHKLAIAILELEKKKKTFLSDLKDRLEIEREKDNLISFLNTSETWYLITIQKTEEDILWLTNRYEQLIKEL